MAAPARIAGRVPAREKNWRRSRRTQRWTVRAACRLSPVSGLTVLVTPLAAIAQGRR